MPATPKDSIPQLRIPPTSEMQQYWQNPEFNYSENFTPQGENFIEWLFRKFFEWLGDIFGKGRVEDAWVYIKIGLIIFALYFVLTKIFKIGIFNIFSKKNKKAANQVMMHNWQEDIHELDFDKKITDALQQKHYREAIRLRFLKILKLLTDNDFIHWSIEKTNRDYLSELTQNRLYQPFNDIVLIFDYIWYGEYEIKNQDEYLKFERQFTATEKIIEQYAKN